MINQQQKFIAIASGTVAFVILGFLIYYKRNKTNISADQTDDEKREGDEFADLSTENIASAFQTVIEITVPQHIVGGIIGKGGTNIRELKSEFGVRLDFEKEPASSDSVSKDEKKFRTLIIKGEREKVHAAEARINKIIAEAPEFVKAEVLVPQEACGRIIGKGGINIREMCNASGAKIIVDRNEDHALGNKRRVLLSGTTIQVEYAKGLIEEKVELEKYHDNRRKTLEEAGMKAPPKDIFPTIKLPDNGEYFKAFVSAYESPTSFWIQLVTKEATNLDKMIKEMTEYYKENDKDLLTQGNIGELCIAPFADDEDYYRATITRFNNDRTVDLFYIDFGDKGMVPINSLRKIKEEFKQLPAQAVHCSLPIVSKGTWVWSQEGMDEFETLSKCALWVPLVAKIVDHKETSDGNLPLLQLIDPNNQEGDISSILVAKGYAKELRQDSLEKKSVEEIIKAADFDISKSESVLEENVKDTQQNLDSNVNKDIIVKEDNKELTESMSSLDDFVDIVLPVTEERSEQALKINEDVIKNIEISSVNAANDNFDVIATLEEEETILNHFVNNPELDQPENSQEKTNEAKLSNNVDIMKPASTHDTAKESNSVNHEEKNNKLDEFLAKVDKQLGKKSDASQIVNEEIITSDVPNINAEIVEDRFPDIENNEALFDKGMVENQMTETNIDDMILQKSNMKKAVQTDAAESISTTDNVLFNEASDKVYSNDKIKNQVISEQNINPINVSTNESVNIQNDLSMSLKNSDTIPQKNENKVVDSLVGLEEVNSPKVTEEEINDIIMDSVANLQAIVDKIGEGHENSSSSLVEKATPKDHSSLNEAGMINENETNTSPEPSSISNVQSSPNVELSKHKSDIVSPNAMHQVSDMNKEPASPIINETSTTNANEKVEPSSQLINDETITSSANVGISSPSTKDENVEDSPSINDKQNSISDDTNKTVSSVNPDENLNRLLSFDDNFVDIDISTVNGAITAIVSEHIPTEAEQTLNAIPESDFPESDMSNSLEKSRDFDDKSTPMSNHEDELQRSLDETSRKNVMMSSMELARENLLMISQDNDDTDTFNSAASNITITDTDETTSYFTATEGRSTPTNDLSVSVPDLSHDDTYTSLDVTPTRNRSSSKFEIQFIDENTNAIVSRESLSASLESSLKLSVSKESIGKETTV